jgi:tRNA dimethylallyltransferase
MIRVLVIMGATASGKSALALELAHGGGREIISADSRQVYRGLRVGTAQPTAAERERVKHHLIDFLPLEDRYNAQSFVDDTLALIRENSASPPLIVGGTGFYLRSLWQGLFTLDAPPEKLRAAREELDLLDTAELVQMLERDDPLTAERLHPNDRQRILRAMEVQLATGLPLSEHHARGRDHPEDIEWVRVLLKRERGELRERIGARTEIMIDGGWLEECRQLHEQGVSRGLPGMGTLGYPELLDHLEGKSTLDEARELIVNRTRQFARRQEIWFGKETLELTLDPGDPASPDKLAGLLAV